MFCGKTLLTSDDKTKMKSNKKTTDASTIIPVRILCMMINQQVKISCEGNDS